MTSTTFALAVIIASVREGRFGPVVASWFVGQAKQRDDRNVDVIVTPEYNHGYPGPLKTAIDSVGRQRQAKPVAFVCYGGLSGGLRAPGPTGLVGAHTAARQSSASLLHLKMRPATALRRRRFWIDRAADAYGGSAHQRHDFHIGGHGRLLQARQQYVGTSVSSAPKKDELFRCGRAMGGNFAPVVATHGTVVRFNSPSADVTDSDMTDGPAAVRYGSRPVKVLFVHGALVGDGAWWWRRMTKPLARRGLSTSAVVLPSCAKVPGEIGDMYADAAAVSDAVATAGEPTILCGHPTAAP